MTRSCVLPILLIGCAQAAARAPDATPRTEVRARPAAADADAVRRGPYLGESVGDRPAMFGRGVVSRQYQELNAAFSPAGDELYFTLADAARSHYTLLRMVRRADGTWREPAVAPFSGRYADADPIFSPDGERLYFISTRPTGADPAHKDFDIWYVDRREAGWGEPVNVGPPVNTPDDEYYVSVTRDGTLYWSRNGDIYRAAREGSRYRAERLGAAVNGKRTEEFDPFVAPDESYLVFGSVRPGSLGSADLYVSFRAGGAWQPARSLGPTINSEALEYCPIASPDGSVFFFTSYRKTDAGPPARAATLEELIASFDQIENGLGNIYWMKADFLEAMRRGGSPP
jgi:WD40-like Beta Propeller Repeat